MTPNAVWLEKLDQLCKIRPKILTTRDDCVRICTIRESLIFTIFSGAVDYTVAVSNPSMVCLDVSPLIPARLGAAFTLDVDAGPQSLIDVSTKALESSFLRGTIQAIRVQGGVLVRGTLESQLVLECVRCLEPFTFPITLELEEIFRFAGTESTPEILYSVSDSGWLDLTPLLREQSWLSIPLKPLCSPDCKGLCPQCGVNLNLESCTCENAKINPHLAVLKEFL